MEARFKATDSSAAKTSRAISSFSRLNFSAISQAATALKNAMFSGSAMSALLCPGSLWSTISAHRKHGSQARSSLFATPKLQFILRQWFEEPIIDDQPSLQQCQPPRPALPRFRLRLRPQRSIPRITTGSPAIASFSNSASRGPASFTDTLVIGTSLSPNLPDTCANYI